MKTTVDLPDEMLREAKVLCARQGRTLRDLLSEALAEKLKNAQNEKQPEWETLFGAFGGKGTARETRRIDTIISREFGQIEDEEWT